VGAANVLVLLSVVLLLLLLLLLVVVIGGTVWNDPAEKQHAYSLRELTASMDIAE
jgi:hypothetical protein